MNPRKDPCLLVMLFDYVSRKFYILNSFFSFFCSIEYTLLRLGYASVVKTWSLLPELRSWKACLFPLRSSMVVLSCCYSGRGYLPLVKFTFDDFNYYIFVVQNMQSVTKNILSYYLLAYNVGMFLVHFNVLFYLLFNFIVYGPGMLLVVNFLFSVIF